MTHVVIPESIPQEFSQSQKYDNFEPTQLSQPYFSQTQNTQGTAFANSQVEPRRKYWAILIPTNRAHDILKIPWNKQMLQIGRGGHQARNDVMLSEKRVSNVHCRITLGIQSPNGSGGSVQGWKDGEAAPEVWLEDMKSSNGTYVNGDKILVRRLLQHGDEISLGHASTLENHDVRFIFRSVGTKGSKLGGSRGMDMVGEVFQRYQFFDQLGKGSFAEVRKAVDIETGDLRAIKQITKYRFAANPKTVQLFQREIDICQRLDHENICRLIEWFEDPQHINLVLEYIDGGDLLDHIMNWPTGGLPEDYACRLTYQICSAMAYTHALGVTHRDLKPENILLTKETDGAEPRIKIADFGLAKMVHNETMLVSMVGTPQYLAPEVVMQTQQKPGYENKVDSWSVGIIVYSMMTKALPFDEDAELSVEKRIRARYTQGFDVNLLHHLNVSAAAIDFISGLLAKDPEDRMSMNEALEHEWLAGPSSQPTESQAYRALGGDSQWRIEEFDGPSEDENTRWNRLQTVSGTNFGSNCPSEDGFSQPLHNLHLNTPGNRTTLPRTAAPTESPDYTTLNQPPTPPLTADIVLASATKRKGTGTAFSSGSLSPVPAEDCEAEVQELERSERSARPRKSMRVM